MNYISLALRYPKSLWSYNPIPYGCVLYLPLWHPSLRGATFKSIDPYGKEVTVNGATKVADGFSFDGTNQNIDLPASLLTGQIIHDTFSLWTKYDISNTGYLFSMDLNETSVIQSGGGDILLYYDGAARAQDTPDWTTNTWVNLTFTLLKNGTCYIYTNGTELTNGAMPNAAITNAAARLGEGTDGPNDFTGTIGEFTVWNRVLTAAEVLYYYNQTRGRY